MLWRTGPDRRVGENRGDTAGDPWDHWGKTDTSMNGTGTPTRRATAGVAEMHDQRECPECEESVVRVDVSRGETVCADCGIVVDDRVVDRGPEWRGYDEDGMTKAHVGIPLTTTLHDHGLTTSIDWRNRDKRGQSLSPSNRQRSERLRTWQERIRVRDASERNLRYALSEIQRMASVFDVSSTVRESSSMIYRQALAADLIRGRSIEGMASAAFYVACRQEGVPRSLDEVASISRVDKREIGRAFRYLTAELDLQYRPVEPSTYVPRFCSELDLDEAVQTTALCVLDRATDAGLHTGKSPSGFAAGAVYLAAMEHGQERTQAEAASVTEVTEVTVRNHYRTIEEFLADEGSVHDGDR